MNAPMLATSSMLSILSGRDPLRWSEHADCLDAPDLPWLADHPSSVDVSAMAAVCASCPVRLACAAYATTVDVTGGFWAGHHRDPATPLDNPERVTSTSSAGLRVTWETLALPGLEAMGDVA